jgi:hypothetical protein
MVRRRGARHRPAVEHHGFGRCIGLTERLRYCALDVVNLSAYVATDSAELRCAGYPVGRHNDRHIEAAAKECVRVVLAWGRARGPAGETR